jgi:two-component system alkaline phosphatase synthesis response regulator PhoP
MNKKRILVVDDERHMQRLIQFNLEKTGCIVETAASGEAALALIARNPIDLMLIDLVMPGLDGFATVRELRKIPGGSVVPVIMLTSRGQADAREQAEGLGISTFLTKPFSPIELIAEVRKLLGL